MPQKILVIDDHPETLKVVSFILRRYGYDVTTVQEGLEGIAAAETQRPDLILLDVMMPGIDGYEVCRRFRAHADLLNVPIIMFTAKSQIDEKWAGFQAGADDYVIKPTEPEELVARIEALLPRPPAVRPAKLQQTAVPLTISGASEPWPQRSPQDHGLPSPEMAGSCAVALIGARGGAGATTIALNLAATLATSDHPTILADLDMNQGHIAMYLNQKVHYGVNDLAYLEGQELQEALIQNLVAYRDNLAILLARPNLDHHLSVLSTDQVTAVVKALRVPGRSIVADLGSGVARFAPQLLQQFSHVLVCLQPDRVGMWATQLLLKQLQKQLQSTTALHTLILDFADGAHLPTNAVADFLRHPVMATIPLNKAEMAQVVNRGQLFVEAKPGSEATAVFFRIARLLLPESMSPKKEAADEATKRGV
jgi:CheY-like chemotaxis protein/MinD-like ATPase involved in chromosome partitioning or flagellar assembly